MSESSPDKPKLIIDEDWKTQVEREREELKRKEASQSPAAVSPSNVEDPAGDSVSANARGSHADSHSDKLPPPPPASFPFLVSMLGTQALAAMGEFGNDPGAPPPRLDYAKHYIDLLGVLEEKTQSNLSLEESALLRDWLHQLRMAYVEQARHGRVS